VFASARDTGSLGHRRHTWTGQPFTKLYVADVGEMSLGSPAKFDKSINSKFNLLRFLLKMVKTSISQETTISREERKRQGMTVR
jgi:hypothetical protein